MFGDIWGETINNLWFQLTLLLTVAIASNFLFARFGQPKVIGQIVIGIIIGPSLLGIIIVNPDPSAGDMVQWLAKLGAIILLFMIGLECNIREIYTRMSITIALGGVLVPWIGGYLLAELMLPDPGISFDKFSQSVFIGAALVATSVAITAGVLKEMGVIGSRVAKTILGAAVVDDILGMIVLAISAGTAKGQGIDLVGLSWIILAAILFVGLGVYLGSKFAVNIISAVEKRGIARGIEESGFLLALSLAFLYAFIAEVIGISAIVGAFVAGTSFAKCEYRLRFQQWGSILAWVFAPIFFMSLGILVNIRLPAEVWLFALALTAVAFATKIVGCGVPARAMGMSVTDSISVGAGMAPRLEVAMIIALYGLSAGIINREIYSVIVIMGLLTALFTPSILRRTLKDVPKMGDVCPPEERW